MDFKVRRAGRADVYEIAAAHADSIRSIGALYYPVDVVSDWGARVNADLHAKAMGRGEVFFIESIVRRFALSGTAVATTARSPLPPRQNPSLFVQTDIGTVEGVQKVVDRIQQEWIGVDILVNSVGGSDPPNGGFQALTDGDWQRALNVNLLAAVRLNRAFIPGMVEPKSGVVLHISSIQHRLPLYDATLAYAAAKGALSTYNKGLANEVGPERCSSEHDLARIYRDSKCPWNDYAACSERRHY